MSLNVVLFRLEEFCLKYRERLFLAFPNDGRLNRVTSLRRIFRFFFLVDKTEINETKYKGSSEVANAQSLSSILNDRGHVTHTTGARTIGKHKVNPSYNCLWALVMYFWPSAIN